jgi:hypothetical protein
MAEPVETLEGVEEPGIELGDTIVILGGSLNKTRGKLYEFTDDRFSILPIGATDRIIKIPLVDGAPDSELGITEIKILKKTPQPGFVHLVDLRAGQMVETFLEGPVQGPKFKVLSVNEDDDSAVFQDEAGAEIKVEFGYRGIPRELGYEVMRTLESPAEEQGQEEAGKAEGAAKRLGAEATEPKSLSEQLDEEDVERSDEGQVPSFEEEQKEEEEGQQQVPKFTIVGKVTLEKEKEIKEIGSSFRIYQDVFQRSEMLGELIRNLPQIHQRNPTKLQEMRRLVELMIILRNDVVQYGLTGEPRGLKPTSANTLAELVTRPDVTMVKKVANVSKVLYMDHSLEHTLSRRQGEGPKDAGAGALEEAEGLYLDYLGDVIRQSETLDKLAAMGSEGQGAEEPGAGMPKFFLDLETYRQKIQTPYRIQQAVGKPPLTADEEVFRMEVPSIDDPAVSVKASGPFHQPPPQITQAPFSQVRALKSRTTRFPGGVGEEFRIVETGENPSYDKLLVFPRSSLRTLGPIRSGSLARDASLGLSPVETMDALLRRLGEINDFPTADGILLLGANGNILGNVLVKDWLENLNILVSGINDILLELRGYGSSTTEWNVEQVAVVQQKIEQHLAGLKMFISRQREENKAAIANLKFEPQSLLTPAEATRLIARVEGEPLLQKVLEKVRDYIGDLAGVDVNWFSYVFLEYPDLLLATLGQQPEILTKERLRHVRDQFNRALATGYRIKQTIVHAGEPPTENLCAHVAELEKNRKLGHKYAEEPRDTTKMKAMLRLLNKFRGRTEENWVFCNVCENHLICEHELLQIQEFLRPREKDALQKEIVLKFSGGQFGSQFICKVCGQGIQELDFDTNIEFDDAGRPMMGRSVMVDEDAIRQEKMEAMLSGPEGLTEEEEKSDEYPTQEMTIMYGVMKKIASQVGINPEPEDFRKMVDDLNTYLSGLPTREAYAAAAAQAKGKKAQDYDIYYSVRYVSAAAAILLINIQTHIPDYIIYYSNVECRDGFFGYPLESEENLTGLSCVATVTAGINDNEFPFNATTLQRQPDLVKRRDALLTFAKNQLKAFADSPLTQAALKRKRDYRVRLYGSSEGIKKDQIPQIFRPVPYILKEEEAAADAVVAEAASPENQAVAWIRMSHKIAREKAALNPDSPYSETTCCLHNVQEGAAAQSNWTSLPKLEPRTAGQIHRSATVSTTFYTEKPKAIEGKIEEKDYYKLFARLCSRGPAKGLPHQLGVGLTCGQCDLIFNENPTLNYIADADPKKAKEAKDAEAAADLKLKSHIEAQGIIINEETFSDLLMTSRLASAVSETPAPEHPKANQTFEWLANHPPAMDGWVPMLSVTQKALRELTSGGAATGSLTKIQIAEAAAGIVKAVSEKEELIKERLGAQAYAYIEAMLKRSPRECGESISTYLLVPYQRWLSGFRSGSLYILDSYELSSGTKDDILGKGMGQHLQAIGGEELEGIALRKVRAFVGDLSVVCLQIFPKIRALLTPGGKEMVQYIMRAYLMSAIHRFIDPHQIPVGSGDAARLEEAEEDAGGVPNIKLLYKSLGQALTKYAVGSKVPTEEEIRTRLEQRAEEEKQVFINKLDRMGREEKRVELVLKGLGMGAWAAGGSKAIRKYDADRYEVERAERAAAGIMDYPGDQGAGGGGQGQEQGRAVDMFGFNFGGEYDAAGEGGEGGYDHEQMAEDDY